MRALQHVLVRLRPYRFAAADGMAHTMWLENELGTCSCCVPAQRCWHSSAAGTLHPARIGCMVRLHAVSFLLKGVRGSPHGVAHIVVGWLFDVHQLLTSVTCNLTEQTARCFEVCYMRHPATKPTNGKQATYVWSLQTARCTKLSLHMQTA
jgi:hypothetical protein